MVTLDSLWFFCIYNGMLPAFGLSCLVLDAHEWQVYWLTARSSSSHGSTAGSSQLDNCCNKFGAAP